MPSLSKRTMTPPYRDTQLWHHKCTTAPHPETDGPETTQQSGRSAPHRCRALATTADTSGDQDTGKIGHFRIQAGARKDESPAAGVVKAIRHGLPRDAMTAQLIKHALIRTT